MSLLYYLYGCELMVCWSGACVLHELGHYTAIRLSGGRIARLRLTCTGAEMHLSGRHRLSEWREVCAALAGPAASLGTAFAAAAAGERGYLFAGINLMLGCFNLLPLPQLDGGRALFHIMKAVGAEEQSECVLKAAAVLFEGLLCVLALYLTLHKECNITLVLTLVWLLVVNNRKKG